MFSIDNPSIELWPSKEYDKFCHAWVATAIIGAAAVGGLSTAYSANRASAAQREATQTAAGIATQQYQRTRDDLAPFRQTGIDASAELKDRLPFLTSPIVMDQETLEGTPGYKFALTQGLKGVQNSVAARGLGVSGAALKGAATFATGLADSTYKTQFDIENTNRTNAFNRLKALIDTGAGAATGTGVLGAKAAETAGGAVIGGGNAAAAGINATGAGITRAASDIGGYMAYRGLYGGNSGGGSGAPLDYVRGAAGPQAVPTYGQV